MSPDLAETIAAVRDRVTPSAEERDALEEVVDLLLARTEATVAEADVEADVLRVGSTARQTWLRGDRDIDIFVRFDPSYSREELEREGIAIGKTVLPDGELEYAEHPYVTAEFEGYSVDLVPCFRVESGAKTRSAVDRTPFHAEYVKERLDPTLATDVRVLKRFCEAIGVYGSDLRTEGFSGYLTELLVLEFGSVEGVLEAAASWHPPVHLDPEDHGIEEFEDSLVVIDPTDPARNVAAVVSAENVARFQHHVRAVLAEPSIDKFEPPEIAPLTDHELRDHLQQRETTPIAVQFAAPDVVEDQLYPQLRSSVTSISNALDAHGFDVVRTTTFADETAVLYFELAVRERPAIERHAGPPVQVQQHAAAFLDRYADADVYGPFIEGDRYVVERPREIRTAAALLTPDHLLNVGLGKDIRRVLAEGYDVLENDDVTALLPEFGRELRRFYEPSP